MSTPKQPVLNLNDDNNDNNEKNSPVDLKKPMLAESGSVTDSPLLSQRDTGYFTAPTSVSNDRDEEELIFEFSEESGLGETSPIEPKQEEKKDLTSQVMTSKPTNTLLTRASQRRPALEEKDKTLAERTPSNTYENFRQLIEEQDANPPTRLLTTPRDSKAIVENSPAARAAQIAQELKLFLLMRELIEFPFLVFAPAALTAGVTRTLVNWLVETHFPTMHSELGFALNAAIPSLTANIVFAAGTYRREALRNSILHRLQQDINNLGINWEQAAKEYPILAPDKKWRETLKAYGVGFAVFTGFPYANRLFKAIGENFAITNSWEKAGIQSAAALGTTVLVTAAFYLGMLAVKQTRLPLIVAFQVGLGVLGLLIASDLFRTTLNNDVGMQILKEVLSCITAGLFACAPLTWQLDKYREKHYKSLPQGYNSPCSPLFFACKKDREPQHDEEFTLLINKTEPTTYGTTEIHPN